MDPSPVQYATSGDVHIAYQTVGNGPFDVVLSFSAISHLEVMWEEPACAAQFRQFGQFARLILFDKRGVGLSDRNVGIATLEDRMDDIRAVLDALGSRKAVLFGTLDGAALSVLYAATYPEKTLALVLWGGRARGLWADDYPWARSREEWEAEILRSEADWGSDAHVQRVTAQLAPSRLTDPVFLRWMGRRLRFGASPASGAALDQMNMLIDVRPALPAIHVPTLVMYTPASRAVSIEDGKYLATHIPGAQLAEVDCPDHLFWTTTAGTDQVLAAVQRFVQGLTAPAEEDRVLTTVMFTDIVSSTRRASELGDRQWGSLLERHLARSRLEIARHRGTVVKSTGDGVMAIFDGPTRAVRCGLGLLKEAQTDDLALRVGLHTGECVVRAGDIQGIAVHIASRLLERAGPGEILASGTVRDLSVGSGIPFLDRGAASLRGVDGRWRVFAVGEAEGGGPADSVPAATLPPPG